MNFEKYFKGYSRQNPEDLDKKFNQAMSDVVTIVENGMNSLLVLKELCETLAVKNVLIHPNFIARFLKGTAAYRKDTVLLFNDSKVFNTACSIAEAVGGESWENSVIDFVNNADEDPVLSTNLKDIQRTLQLQNSERVGSMYNRAMSPEVTLLKNMVEHHWAILSTLRSCLENRDKYAEIREKVLNSIEKSELEEAV